MSAVLTEQQVGLAVATATAMRAVQVPRRWLLVRLSVVVDGRLLAVREEGARRAAAALAEVIWPSPGMVTFAVQGQAEAAVTLRSMREQRAAASSRVVESGHLLSLPDDDALDAATEQLAAAPHGVLVVASVGVDGHRFAARWS